MTPPAEQGVLPFTPVARPSVRARWSRPQIPLLFIGIAARARTDCWRREAFCS
jgi:hypothetical protein